MRKIALIPVKGSSSRLPHKNFRPFLHGRSLTELKIEQLIENRCFDEIYLSSETGIAREIAHAFQVGFLPRPELLCRDETPWAEVLTGIVGQVPEPDDALIAWCPVTSPCFSRYAEAVATLEASPDYDGIFTTTELRHFYLSHDFLPINHQWGPWARYSQQIKPIYQLNMALTMTSKGQMLKNRFQISTRPLPFITTLYEGIDIDTPDEFALAQFAYGRLIGNEEAGGRCSE